jgi:hypothetical protein
MLSFSIMVYYFGLRPSILPHGHKPHGRRPHETHNNNHRHKDIPRLRRRRNQAHYHCEQNPKGDAACQDESQHARIPNLLPSGQPKLVLSVHKLLTPNRVGGGSPRRPPTPPCVRFRTRRFLSACSVVDFHPWCPISTLPYLTDSVRYLRVRPSYEASAQDSQNIHHGDSDSFGPSSFGLND